MSRAAVFDAIIGDPQLQEWGLGDEDHVFSNYSLEVRPTDGPFCILRWEESTGNSQTYTGMRNGLRRAPRVLTVWVHYPDEISTDFNEVDKRLNRIEEILTAMEQVPGEDNYTVTCITYSGRSRDLHDDSFNTICRNAAFVVLSRPS